MAGFVVGASLTWTLVRKYYLSNLPHTGGTFLFSYEERKRQRLPDVVILVRHGESEGNIDKTLWWKLPDNEIRLTETGRHQANLVGKRIEKVFRNCEEKYNMNMSRIHIHVSPFERTLETARLARQSFEHRVVRQNVCPRLREQEFGNMQSADFESYRQEQTRVGRFWYRFPTGESGTDGKSDLDTMSYLCVLEYSTYLFIPSMLNALQFSTESSRGGIIRC